MTITKNGKSQFFKDDEQQRLNSIKKQKGSEPIASVKKQKGNEPIASEKKESSLVGVSDFVLGLFHKDKENKSHDKKNNLNSGGDNQNLRSQPTFAEKKEENNSLNSSNYKTKKENKHSNFKFNNNKNHGPSNQKINEKTDEIIFDKSKDVKLKKKINESSDFDHANVNKEKSENRNFFKQDKQKSYGSSHFVSNENMNSDGSYKQKFNKKNNQNFSDFANSTFDDRIEKGVSEKQPFKRQNNQKKFDSSNSSSNENLNKDVSYKQKFSRQNDQKKFDSSNSSSNENLNKDASDKQKFSRQNDQKKIDSSNSISNENLNKDTSDKQKFNRQNNQKKFDGSHSVSHENWNKGGWSGKQKFNRQNNQKNFDESHSTLNENLNKGLSDKQKFYKKDNQKFSNSSNFSFKENFNKGGFDKSKAFKYNKHKNYDSSNSNFKENENKGGFDKSKAFKYNKHKNYDSSNSNFKENENKGSFDKSKSFHYNKKKKYDSSGSDVNENLNKNKFDKSNNFYSKKKYNASKFDKRNFQVSEFDKSKNNKFNKNKFKESYDLEDETDNFKKGKYNKSKKFKFNKKKKFFDLDSDDDDDDDDDDGNFRPMGGKWKKKKKFHKKTFLKSENIEDDLDERFKSAYIAANQESIADEKKALEKELAPKVEQKPYYLKEMEDYLPGISKVFANLPPSDRDSEVPPVDDAPLINDPDPKMLLIKAAALGYKAQTTKPYFNRKTHRVFPSVYEVERRDKVPFEEALKLLRLSKKYDLHKILLKKPGREYVLGPDNKLILREPSSRTYIESLITPVFPTLEEYKNHEFIQRLRLFRSRERSLPFYKRPIIGKRALKTFYYQKRICSYMSHKILLYRQLQTMDPELRLIYDRLQFELDTLIHAGIEGTTERRGRYVEFYETLGKSNDTFESKRKLKYSVENSSRSLYPSIYTNISSSIEPITNFFLLSGKYTLRTRRGAFRRRKFNPFFFKVKKYKWLNFKRMSLLSNHAFTSIPNRTKKVSMQLFNRMRALSFGQVFVQKIRLSQVLLKEVYSYRRYRRYRAFNLMRYKLNNKIELLALKEYPSLFKIYDKLSSNPVYVPQYYSTRTHLTEKVFTFDRVETFYLLINRVYDDISIPNRNNVFSLDMLQEVRVKKSRAIYIKKFFNQKLRFKAYLASSISDKFIRKINITMTQNNVFCNCIDLKNDRVVHLGSSGAYNINVSRRTLKQSYKYVLDNFFHRIESNLQNYCNTIIYVVAPGHFRPRLLRYLKYKFTLHKQPYEKRPYVNNFYNSPELDYTNFRLDGEEELVQSSEIDLFFPPEPVIEIEKGDEEEEDNNTSGQLQVSRLFGEKTRIHNNIMVNLIPKKCFNGCRVRKQIIKKRRRKFIRLYK